ncbi:MAG TPA: PAS domain-containing sensor histidine kinase [Candidatus Angelobacter sp.]|nr:PAS domain-containing sensor histidine kinase [Candidatus Angelobacter sp.]
MDTQSNPSDPGRLQQASSAETDRGELARTRQLLALIVESSNDAIISEDLNGTITSWNRGAERIFGFTESEVIGKPVSILYMPGKSEEMPAILERIRAGERVEHYETLRRHKNGHSISVSLTVSPIRDEDGNIIGASKISRDITEIKRLVERAQFSIAETQFRKLLEAAPDGILEVNAEGKITVLNEAAERMFGYGPGELVGGSIEALVPAAMRGGHSQHRASYAGHPKTRPMGTGLELQGQRKDGSLFPVEISLSPNWSEGSLHVIASVRDITERKLVEDRIRVLREQYTAELTAKNEQLEARNLEIEQANRLKDEFLASMSHELRTPLHTIIGFSELLTEQLEGPLNEKQHRFIGHILQDARHLLNLINEVLDISKIESGRLELKREIFDFGHCVEEVLAGLRPQAASKNIMLENKSSSQTTLYADRMRVKEILYNLLSNAVKFTPEGGTVWVESTHDVESLRVSVCDTGIGIAKEEQLAIFDKFYQIRDSRKVVREGTGLGLSITKHLVELHGGTICIESQLGQGSRFMLTFPLRNSHPVE